MIKNIESTEKMKSMRKALALLSSKWMMIIINAINVPSRYHEIAARVPDVDTRVLQDKLNVLIQKKLVIKKNHHGAKPYIEYSLSPMGIQALKIVPILEKIGKDL
ncbi:helix-turn-helix transcriptional regulator [Candidatus Dojkabacteria bacterium]|uniref:Helix-turn-helix transcriptional regulator n=1 Tax=Candidatus Dojkabacteria bacterium TaxID=2099670 RepID=A0A955L6R3_9BACT|nr:helix-turn-helix transcriptional regulator [Candidatus Dojkabacteria bacterium]